MPTTLKSIENNEVSRVDFMAMTIDENFMKELAISLKQNRSVTEIDLSLCNMIDSEFEILKNSLLKHPALNVLNISENELTEKSVPSIIELLESEKFKELRFSYNEKISKNYEIIKNLDDIAKNHNITFIIENPIRLRIESEKNQTLLSSQSIFSSAANTAPSSPATSTQTELTHSEHSQSLSLSRHSSSGSQP